MITRQEIDAFLAVAQCGSISSAARQLYVTQPALSRRIRSIENDMGCCLFERGRGVRGITLTDQGKAFLPIARRWLEVYRDTLTVKDTLDKPRLKISSVGSVRSFLLPGILRDATSDDAPYRIDFNLCHSTEAPSLVEAGLTDVALVDLDRNPNQIVDSIVAAPVYTVPFVLIGGPHWHECKSVSSDQLDPKREVRLPWNYHFDIWHDRRFGEATSPMVRLDSAASIEHVLRDDLFCILPKTEAMRISAIRPDVATIDLLDGPPDETIHCLMLLSSASTEKMAYFNKVLKRNLRNASGVETLM